MRLARKNHGPPSYKLCREIDKSKIGLLAYIKRSLNLIKKGWSEMKSRFLVGLCALVLAGISCVAAQDSMSMKQDPMVGGAAMYPTKNIVENAVKSADHTTLVAAVKAAGLVDTLEGAGPFTVFAPTNEAFAKLTAGTVDPLVKPESKAMLTKILTYHVVPGHLTEAAIAAMTNKGGGKAMRKTVQGQDLPFARGAGHLWG